MVKLLYFNPSDFNQLILSGLLIQIYKNDIQCHTSQQSQGLRFEQGSNVIEASIEAILRFANSDKRKKYFGLNAQQQAVIQMVNGVCKDIDSKVSTAQSPDEIRQKVSYLNEFWSSPSNSWLTQRFYQCHMNILTLSFRIQEKFPEILIQQPVFVDLRKLFISDKWLSKQALIAMFANPFNKYQEFDLFPEAESECSLRSSFGVPAEVRQEDAEIQNVEQDFVQIKTLEMIENSQVYKTKSYLKYKKGYQDQSLYQQIQGQQVNQPIIQQTDTQNAVNLQYIPQQHSQSQTRQFKELKNIESSNIFLQKRDSNHQHNQFYQEPHHVAESYIVKDTSGIVTELASQIKNETDAHINLESQKINQATEVNNKKCKTSDKINDVGVKKSSKGSFSQNQTKRFQQSKRSFTDKKYPQSDTQKQEHKNFKQSQQTHEHINQHHQEKPAPEQHYQKKLESKIQNHQQEQPGVQLKKQVIIDQAESQKHAFQQQVQQIYNHNENENQQQNKIQQLPIKQQVTQNTQQKLLNNAPASQPLASRKAPKSKMQNQIKPKQQPADKKSESCKCQIY